jgi:hypothetical protein
MRQRVSAAALREYWLKPTTATVPAATGISAANIARAHAALRVAVFAVFLVHALNYLYFFVDDEGIPFVFARHLLQGKGLVYNSLEGRVEGYSDFLHVLMATVYLLVARALRFGPLAVFFLAKAVSLASGVATVGVVWKALRRQASIGPPALLAGMAFLVLASPLAIWSCSSLEMASITLLIALLAVNVFEGSPTRDWVTALIACLVILLRIDGFVYVFALLAPAWLVASPARRRDMLRRIAAPVGVVFAAYHTWRVWYFGDWLPAPLAAKVLYKLHPLAGVLVRKPQAPYLLAFLSTYGVVPAILGIGLVIAALRRDRRAWPLLASACMLIAYPALVGDWMLGFRFFLPVLPVMAILIALAVSAINRPAVAWAAAIVVCLWFSGTALRATTTYDHTDYHQIWWRTPSFDPQRYFGPYPLIYNSVRGLVKPGALIAYDQAGFVPYMLDVDNIDDLGICSRFVARLPTTDVVFTEAGRYSPLSDSAALRTANAYVLYLMPDYVIAPLGNLRAANRGEIPERILRNHYVKLFVVPHAPAVVYGRSPEPVAEFRSTPHLFLENVAHPSHVQGASGDDAIPPAEYLQRLAFLAGGTLDRTFSGRISYDVVFAGTNEPIYELHVDGIWARTDVTMVLTLWSADGAVARRETRLVKASRPDRIRLFWPEGPGATRLTLELDAQGSQTRVLLRDLRVQGQPVALARYVEQLSFSSAAATQ